MTKQDPKIDRFIKRLLKRDMVKFIEDEYPKGDRRRGQATVTLTQFLIWVRDNYTDADSGQ